jgi:hypothetical protein
VLAATSACVREPVVWADATYELAGTEHATGEEEIIPVVPSFAQPCDSSFRLAPLGADLHAVWWSPRADSSAALLSARSTDGGHTWGDPVPVDTLDRGRAGCRRPAPSIATDARSGYVDIAYFLQAPEGPGIFFAHSMDHGAMFHSPVAIVYGERPSATSIAVAGDTVAVAYEDPNGTRPSIALALSRTSGHIFESRQIASGTSGSARAPRVTLRGRTIAVVWADASGRMAVRVGELQ